MAAWVGTRRGKDVQKLIEEKRGGKGRQGRGRAKEDRSKLETFQSRVDWTDPRLAEVAPVRKPGNSESTVGCR